MDTLKPYTAFRDAVGAKESSDRYDCVNTLGYVGRYQFGLARLSDFGLCQRKIGTVSFANSSFDWVTPFSQPVFLAAQALQDEVFNRHVYRLSKYIQIHYPSQLNQVINGTLLTLSGAIGCCHLLGIGGLADFVLHNKIDEDAFHTKSTDYIVLFNGYEIPSPPESMAPLSSLVH